MGSPKVESQYVSTTGGQIVSSELGYAATEGVFVKGSFDPTICLNEADFRANFGDDPVEGYENDYWNCIEFFRNSVYGSRGYGKLIVMRVAHYATISDASSLEADQASVTFGSDVLDGLTEVDVFRILDKSPRVSPLSAILEVGDADQSNLFNIAIYEDNVFSERVTNCNMVPSSANYITKMVGSTHDWEAEAITNNRMPLIDSVEEDLTGGANGLTGLIATDFIGAESEDGNTGMRRLLEFMQTVYKPEVFFIPWSSEVDNHAVALELESFCNSYGIIPIMGTPAGLNRITAKAYKEDNTFGNAVGGSLMIWPRYTPPILMSDSPRTRISPEGKKAGLMMATIGRDWIHQTAAGHDYGEGTSIGELEIKTKEADSELLDPIGIQVIREDKGRMIYGHRTLSTDPNYYDEQMRRLDNHTNNSINLSTERLLHRPLTEELMDELETELISYFYNLFVAHPRAFTHDTFAENVIIKVREVNIVNSTDWKAGKLYTYRDIDWAFAVQNIVHKYAHTHAMSVEVDAGV